jgi:hypothetical protein
MTIHTLLPNLGFEDQTWSEAELPELVSLCRSCGGKGRYPQTYTAGCGGGTYTSMGECGHCAGVGLRYFNGNSVPLSVINQILVARQRAINLNSAGIAM